ncbi:hypothetical protein D3C80_1595600 [compost metagenome]
MPPNHGPSALARLNAAWFEAAARLGASWAISIRRICNGAARAIMVPTRPTPSSSVQSDCAAKVKNSSTAIDQTNTRPTARNCR